MPDPGRTGVRRGRPRTPKPPIPPLDRILAKTTRDIATGCWTWTGALTRDGYGQITDGRRQHVYAHRVAYLHMVGPIPDGHQIDHLCRNRRCVNPAHLDAVTHRENVRRQWEAKRATQRAAA